MIPIGSLTSAGKLLPLDTVTNQGLVYWLGTNGGTSGFSNPHSSGKVVCSWIGDGGGTVADMVNRTVGNTHTSNTVNSWTKIDIGGNNSLRRLIPSHMRLQNRDGYDSNLATQVTVTGSNNNTDWTTLGGITSGIPTSRNLWYTITLTPNYGSFRYFRAMMVAPSTSSDWYFCSSAEIELFGTLTE